MATVEQLYQELLGRQADPGGLEYWQKEIGGDGITAEERARFLAAAQPELSTRPANVDVGEIYQQTLGRAPDEEGMRYWQNYFGTEISPEERAAFNAAAQAELAGRQQAATGGDTQGATQAQKAALSPYSSVEQLYSQYLNREVDPGGMEYWSQFFNDGFDVNELAAFQAAAQPELASRAPTVVDQWYNEALKRPADASGRAYWLDQINKVGFTQARNMFYNQAVQELLNRTAVNTPTTPGSTAGTSINTPGANVIGAALPGGSAYQPTTINVGGAGAVTSGGFAAYPYNQTQAAATLGRPAYDVTKYMTQTPVQPFVATPLFGQGQVPFIPNPYVPSPYVQQIPGQQQSAGGLFGGPIAPPPGG